MVHPKSPAMQKRSRNIPAAVHPPGTSPKPNIVPVPVPLPPPNQKSQNPHQNLHLPGLQNLPGLPVPKPPKPRKKRKNPLTPTAHPAVPRRILIPVPPHPPTPAKAILPNLKRVLHIPLLIPNEAKVHINHTAAALVSLTNLPTTPQPKNPANLTAAVPLTSPRLPISLTSHPHLINPGRHRLLINPLTSLHPHTKPTANLLPHTNRHPDLTASHLLLTRRNLIVNHRLLTNLTANLLLLTDPGAVLLIRVRQGVRQKVLLIRVRQEVLPIEVLLPGPVRAPIRKRVSEQSSVEQIK
jgi:hypothetical protein